MTLPCRSLSDADEPSVAEERDVSTALDLSRRLKKLGGKRLLMAQMDWERIYNSANPPGAATPTVAKASLTRDSRRRWELARMARRGNTRAFQMVKAIVNGK